MNTFKIYFSENNIRRITLEDSPNYLEFIALLKDLYPNKFHVELAIKYVDVDGDKISVDTQMEWEEMMHEMKNENAVKLWVEQASEGFDLEEISIELPEVFSLDDLVEEPVDDDLEDFISQLEKNIPEWSQIQVPEFMKDFSMQCVMDNYNAVDVNAMFNELHGKATSLIGSVHMSDIEAGRDYLIDTLKLVPDHMVALYNLACAESLLGNTKDALHYLEQSINNGFSDIDHMIADSDFANIKNTEAFQQLVSRLSARFNIGNPVVEEPVVEPEFDLSESIRPLKDSYGEQLDLLKEMGFSADPDVVLLLLEQYNGNVDEVMQFLLGYN